MVGNSEGMDFYLWQPISPILFDDLKADRSARTPKILPNSSACRKSLNKKLANIRFFVL